MPEIKLFNNPEIKRDFILIIDTEGRWAELQTRAGQRAYFFRWLEDKKTYELIFEWSDWEDLFKSSDLIRQYLDLVLNTLISYKNGVDKILK